MRSITRLGAIAVMAAAAAMGNLAAIASPVPGQGTWETTLQGRYLDRNGMTDAFYDPIWTSPGCAMPT